MAMPDHDPIKADLRRSKRRPMDPAIAACALCLAAPEDGTTLEDDHVLGWRAADTTRVWLCRACHRHQTTQRHDQQAGSPAGRHQPDLSLLERLARALRSLGVFADALAQALCSFADQLADLARGLDLFAPSWRAEPWAA